MCQWLLHGKFEPDPNQQDVWREAVDGLTNWFNLTKTDPDIAWCICDTLQIQEEAKFANFAAHSIATVAVEQDNIGWLDFTEGCISGQWKAAQEVYYMSIGSN